VDDFNVLEVKLRGAGPIQDVQLVLTSFKRHRSLRPDDSSFCSTKRDRASVHTYFGDILFSREPCLYFTRELHEGFASLKTPNMELKIRFLHPEANSPAKMCHIVYIYYNALGVLH